MSDVEITMLISHSSGSDIESEKWVQGASLVV